MARARALKPKKTRIPGISTDTSRPQRESGGVTLPSFTRAKPNKPGKPTGGDPKEGFVPPGRGATVKGGTIKTPKDRAPKKKPKPKGKGPGGKGTKTLTAQQRAEQEMQGIYGPVLGEYARLIKARQDEAAAEAARKQAVYAAFAKYYQEHAPQQIQGIYSQAAAEQSAWGKGYSLGMQLAQQEEAGQSNKFIDLAGGGEGQKITPGPEAGNVIYGLGGGIPANTLSQQGAAFSAAAALQSPAILAEGGRQANELLKLSAQEIEKLRFEELQVRTEMRAKVFDRAETLRQQGQKAKADRLEALQDQAEYMTDKSGVFWVVKGNKVVPTKALTMAGKEFLLKANKAPDIETKVMNGYIWERNPRTGQWQKVGGEGDPITTKYQQGPAGTVFDPVTGRYYDPITGKPVAPPSDTRDPARLQKGPNGSVFDPNTGLYWRNGKPYVPPITTGKGSNKLVIKDPMTGAPMTNSQIINAGEVVRDSVRDAKLKNIPFEKVVADMNARFPKAIWVPYLVRAYGIPVRATIKQLGQMATRAASKLPSPEDSNKRNSDYLKLWRYAILLGFKPNRDEKGNLVRSGGGITAMNLLNFIAGALPKKDEAAQVASFSGGIPQGITPSKYQGAAIAAAQRHGIPVPIFLSMIQAESGWSPTAGSSAGAQGIAQFMPATARSLGIDPMNPVQALDGAARYLKAMYRTFKRWDYALAGYNAGGGAVKKYNGIPPYAETQAYVRRIMAMAETAGGTNQGSFVSDQSGGQLGTSRGGAAWGGTLAVANQFLALAKSVATLSASGKRSRRNTSSGGISDHWTGSKNAWAYDISGSKQQMFTAAYALARALGINWDGRSELIEDVFIGPFRIQIIFNTPKYGGHLDHIHFGVRRNDTGGSYA